MKIYIAKKWRKKTAIDFIKHLIDQKKFPTTYKDKKCRKIQCRQGRSRSIYEITKLVKTYFPKTNEKEIFTTIYYYIKIHNINKNIIYCNNIQSLVLFKNRFSYSKDNNPLYDYRYYFIKKDWKLLNHISIEYFLKKIGFTEKEIKKELSI